LPKFLGEALGEAALDEAALGETALGEALADFCFASAFERMCNNSSTLLELQSSQKLPLVYLTVFKQPKHVLCVGARSMGATYLFGE
jgi:hypothetical protein